MGSDSRVTNGGWRMGGGGGGGDSWQQHTPGQGPRWIRASLDKGLAG